MMSRNTKTLFSITFFLVLYVAPAIFAPSYAIPTIAKESQFTIAYEPWLYGGWEHRRAIEIGGVSGCGTYYQINMTINYDDVPNADIDFEDIRFTDDDKVTELDYWIELIEGSVMGGTRKATVWLEVSDNLDTNQTVYLYWENSTASCESNGTNTMIAFDDFENNNLDRWTEVTDAGSTFTDNTRVKYGSYSCKMEGDGSYDYLRWNVTAAVNGSYMVHQWINNDNDMVGYGMRFNYLKNSTMDTYNIARILEDDLEYYDGSSYNTYFTGTMTVDTWFRLELGIDLIGDDAELYQDGVASGVNPDFINSDTQSDMKQVMLVAENGPSEDYWVDDFYVRKWNPSGEPSYTLGAVEDPPPPQWEDAGEESIYLVVAAFTWPFDMFMLLVGFVMVPSSVMFIVYGGRKNFSMTKLFFGFVALVFGFALIIGVVS